MKKEESCWHTSPYTVNSSQATVIWLHNKCQSGKEVVITDVLSKLFIHPGSKCPLNVAFHHMLMHQKVYQQLVNNSPELQALVTLILERSLVRSLRFSKPFTSTMASTTLTLLQMALSHGKALGPSRRETILRSIYTGHQGIRKCLLHVR